MPFLPKPHRPGHGSLVYTSPVLSKGKRCSSFPTAFWAQLEQARGFQLLSQGSRSGEWRAKGDDEGHLISPGCPGALRWPQGVEEWTAELGRSLAELLGTPQATALGGAS